MEFLVELLGNSPGILAVREKVERVISGRFEAGRRLPALLIQGETGTGKGLLAREIHRASARGRGPLVDINCAAIPDTMLEAELFGYERGAFTDANRAKAGLFQTAHQGTLFLDEIGLLSLALQAKLLKVLEEKTVRRLGSTRSESVDVWVISATNEDLADALRARRFREDLYHRLAIITLALPPLRERGDDVFLLAEHFLTRACDDYRLPPKRLADDARAALRAYSWPGNVRELNNVVERAALLAEAPILTAAHLFLTPSRPRADARAAPVVSPPAPRSAREAMREQLEQVLAQNGWNISRTAAQLGITRNTVKSRIARLGLREMAEGPTESSPGVASPHGTASTAGGRAELHSSGDAPKPIYEAAGPPDVVDHGPGYAEGTGGSHAHRPATPTVSRLRWERRPVTMLRLILGSEDELPAATAAGILDLAIEKVASFGGLVDALTSRGLIAVFGLQETEDAPRRAAHAALAVHTAVARREHAPFVVGRATVRLAIHSASVLVGHAGDVVTIDAEARAELHDVLDRLQTASDASVSISTAARDLLRRHFDVVDDPGGDPAVHRLVPPSPTRLAPTAQDTVFLGREAEIGLLENFFTRVVSGSGVAVLIVGEAGIGKSRLIAELRSRIGDRPASFIEGHCLSLSTSVPYLPMLDILRQLLGIRDSDEPQAVARKARAMLADLGGSPENLGAHLLRLLGVDEPSSPLPPLPADRIKAQTLEALRRILVGAAQRQPLVLVIEDAHWADAATEEFLMPFADALVDAPILLLATARPGHDSAWTERSDVTKLALHRLGPGDSRKLVEVVLSGASAPTATVDAIVARGGGNPFFLEELARTVRERPDGPVAAVPESVQQVFFERLDRLDTDTRRLLQTAAVVGRDGPVQLLARVAGAAGPELNDRLATLRRAQFLLQTGSEDEAGYGFKHALTHDVCYASLADHERRALHARIVSEMEALYADRLTHHVERLAEHALSAERWTDALRYLRQAGLKAVGLSAYADAVACFDKARLALNHLPESTEKSQQGIDVLLDMRGALLPLGDFERIVDSLREAEALADRIEDPQRLARVCAYLTDYYRQIGDPGRALDFGRRALTASLRHGDLSLRVASHIYLAQAHYDLGKYRDAADLLRSLLEIIGPHAGYERFGLPYIVGVHTRTWLSLCLAELGEFREAHAEAERGLEIGRAGDHASSLTSALAGVGRVRFRQGHFDEAIVPLEEGLDLGQRSGIRLFLPMLAEPLGLAYILKGRLGDGLARLEEATTVHTSMRGTAGLSMRLASSSLGHTLAGRADLGELAATRAVEFARKHGEQGHEAHALYALAESYAVVRSSVEAAAAFAAAADLAAALEMRPLLALCRLGAARAAGASESSPDAAAARTRLEELGMASWGPRNARS